MIKTSLAISMMDTENQKNSGEIKNSEYKELVDFLAIKFDEVNEKLDRKADKSEVKEMIEEVKVDVRAVSDRLVRLSDKVDDYHAEQIGMRRDMDRHEKWHFSVADKVGVDLTVD